MKHFIARHKHLLYLAVIFIISELIVNPIGDFPLNDDWTYGKSVLILQNQGKLNIGDFAAMSLYSHILWGFIFTKTFWFSFSILRISTIVSSFIALVFLFKLIVRITNNSKVALFASLVILFNPLYFNLTNTFMTDVNFNTVLILCCYFAYDFFSTQNKLSFVLVFVFSIILVLIRQFGIIVPVCFTAAILFTKQSRFKYLFGAFIFTIIVYAVFTYYESTLKLYLNPNASYKYSSNTHIFSTVFWDTFFYNLNLRDKLISSQILIYVFPFSLLFVKQILRNYHALLILLVVTVSGFFTFYLFNQTPFPYGNVFTNFSLGSETFYETLYYPDLSPHEHTYSKSFEDAMVILKYVAITITISVVLILLFKSIRQIISSVSFNPYFIFLIAVFCTYILMMLITESYFDRYHIPLITLFIIMLTFQIDKTQINFVFINIVLVFMFYLSVFGTKDYLELNRNRWNAYNYLVDIEKIDAGKINGGFEVNCWNFGKENWWSNFQNLKDFDYLIQYRKEPEFKRYKVYDFQRFLPFKRDTVFVYRRELQSP